MAQHGVNSSPAASDGAGNTDGGKSASGNRNAAGTPKSNKREEPEVTQEESIPSDGRDVEGERLMKKVSNEKLHDKGEAEHRTAEKASAPKRSS